jgi:hypothetical protein
MSRLVRGILPLALLLAVVGCSSDRFAMADRGYEPPPEGYYPPPPRRRTDAKTYLESGRTYDR